MTGTHRERPEILVGGNENPVVIPSQTQNVAVGKSSRSFDDGMHVERAFAERAGDRGRAAFIGEKLGRRHSAASVSASAR